MGKVFVVGAGFSKAVGDLPLTKEMFPCFEHIREEARRLGDRNRALWGDNILAFVAALEERYLKTPLERSGGKTRLLQSGFREQFELILTFIDLNTAPGFEVTVEDEGTVRNARWDIGRFEDLPFDLQELRRQIVTYIYLAVMQGNVQHAVLKLFTDHLLRPGDIVITFNYDLALERYLFQNFMWYPKDGYGVQFHGMPDIAENFKNRTSGIHILKLHGSVNWRGASFLGMPTFVNGDLQLEWFDDNQEEFFPGYLQTAPPQPKARYTGKHEITGLMPSWVKRFESTSMVALWRQASYALRDATEITVIGYSLPPEDSAATCLFAGVDFSGKCVKIIDPCAHDLSKKYARFMHGARIDAHSNTLSEYLDGLPKAEKCE